MVSTQREPHLVLGTAQLTQKYGVLATQAATTTEAARLLSAAASLGISHLDTAPAYGEAEKVIGESGWLGSVHTKISYHRDPRSSLTASLTSLRRSAVDVLYLHDADELMRPGSTVLHDATRLVGDEVGALGASVYVEAQLDAALGTPAIGVLQVPLSVLDRRMLGEPIHRASDAGVRVYVRSVFLQGILLALPSNLPTTLRGLADYVRNVHSIAMEYAVTPAALALGWIRAQRGITGVIIGAQSAGELRELSLAWRINVPAEAIAAVDALELPPPHLVDPRRWKDLT